MSGCDNRKMKPRYQQSGNNCDIFEPSSYVPEESKYRAEYIHRITAKITAEMDTSLLAEEAPDDEEPSGSLEVTGKDPEKHLKFTFKYLKGPRGFRGSLENFVVLSESEYERLRVKDPNIFYFTYEDEEGGGDDGGDSGYDGTEIIDITNNSITGSLIMGNTLITEGIIINNTLNI